MKGSLKGSCGPTNFIRFEGLSMGMLVNPLVSSARTEEHRPYAKPEQMSIFGSKTNGSLQEREYYYEPGQGNQSAR
jgi:hypothetical protein